jgi:hypothetical protein
VHGTSALPATGNLGPHSSPTVYCIAGHAGQARNPKHEIRIPKAPNPKRAVLRRPRLVLRPAAGGHEGSQALHAQPSPPLRHESR